MKINFQCSGVDGLNESYAVDIEVPVGSVEVSKIARDGQILNQIATRHGDQICRLVTLAQQGDHTTAAKIAREIGFTEEAFEQKGGGLWLAIAVGVAALLYSQSAH